MTMLASWVGVDTHGVSSAYIISDSRISWEAKDFFDHGKKVFASSNYPEIFGYAGDVLFPSIVLQQIIEMIDSDVLFSREMACEKKNKIVFEKLRYELSNYPIQRTAKSFYILHISRDTIVHKAHKDNYPEFNAYLLQYNGSKWHRSSLSIPKESGCIKILGSGEKDFSRNYQSFQNGCNKDTSRNVVHCFIETLKSQTDSCCGGAPQIVGIYRKPNTNGQYFGVVYNNKRYFAGSEVPAGSRYTNIEWRNECFERCDGKNKKRIEGAQRQPYSKG